MTTNGDVDGGSDGAWQGCNDMHQQVPIVLVQISQPNLFGIRFLKSRLAFVRLIPAHPSGKPFFTRPRISEGRISQTGSGHDSGAGQFSGSRASRNAAWR